MTPDRCPYFASCSANICPLDSDWPARAHLKGESVCVWLRESVKTGGEALLRGRIGEELTKEVLCHRPEMESTHAPIKWALKRAAKTPSRIAAPIQGQEDAA